MDNYLKGMVEEIPEKREKRYILIEAPEKAFYSSITESELRRRLRAIIALEVTGATLDELAEIAIPMILHGEEKPGKACPFCGRQKARNFKDCAKGFCPKWYAMRDPDAAQDCVEHSLMPPTIGSYHPQGTRCAPQKEKTAPTRVDPDEGRNPVTFTPTRKDFAHNLADAIYYRATPDILTERLLAIPCAKESAPNAETHDQWVERMPRLSNFKWIDWEEKWTEAMKQWHREEPH